MKNLIIFSVLFIALCSFRSPTIVNGENIKVSVNEGKNSVSLKCKYPKKYYQEILQDIQKYDPQFAGDSKEYTLGNGSIKIQFKSKSNLMITYRAKDKDYEHEKQKLLGLIEDIQETLNQN